MPGGVERAGLDWEKYVRFDERYERPAEVDHLLGDATKAKEVLAWEPKVRSRSWCGSWWMVMSSNWKTGWPGGR
ncbi:MAG: GDP-mannose 4,6-dehydratase [Actinomycetota bacterium]|nr:GDP-mannose 4,6-dehydratase [Actinomycetota bacterium]